MLYELSYESVSRPDISTSVIDGILETSRENNAALNVTGCLISYNGRFIQLLEGEKQTVKDLYEKIRRDKRHNDVRLIGENIAKERTFPKWGMAYFPIDENHVSGNELEQFRRNLKLLADFSNPSSVTSILFWVKVKALLAEPPRFDLK